MITSLPFPRLKFCRQNNVVQQLMHIRSELMEVELALETEAIERVAEELADLMISAKTALDIIEALYGIHPLDVVTRVHEKNRQRGYLE